MARFQSFFAVHWARHLAKPTLLLLLGVMSIAQTVRPCSAGERLEQFLPATTKGFVSFPDIDRAIRRWDNTQLGQMMADPAMKPFVEEVQDMFQGDFLQLGKRLGVRVGQLQELRGGEVCLAFVQPGGAVTEHAAVLLMDVRGRELQATQLLESVASDLQAQGATQIAIQSTSGVRIMVTSLPTDDAAEPSVQRKSYSVIHDGRLFITDRVDVAEQMLGLMSGGPGSLNDVAAFRSVMSKWDNKTSDVRWFIEPFGLIEVLRASQVTPEQNSIDIVQVLSNQGFRAIEGVGGHIRLSTGSHEILHRTMIYAPGKAQSGRRFELAARMLSFPNSKNMAPLSWIPANITTHITMRWDLLNAFEHSKSLVNEVAGEKVFDEILENIKTDENGPQIDIRKELVAQFGDRITVIADRETPINEDSERLAVAIALKDEASVRAAIDRAMGNDPKAHAHAVGNYRIWEMGGADEEDEEIVVMIDDPFAGNPFGPSLTPMDDEEECEDDEPNDELLSNVCIAVAHGQLLVSKKFGLLHRLLSHDPKSGKLKETNDFAAVREALQQLGSNADCMRFFVRTDLAYEPAYELLRSGRMPEANSLFARVLNRFAQPKSPGRPRTQKIDGQTMPPFDQVRRYLGPAGMFMVSTKEGWIITGCLLKNRTGA